MALPAFTFVFTFMPLLLSRLKLVSTTRDSCLAAPNCATGLYLRFHVHVHTPFSLSWSSIFLPADFGPCSVTPDCVACFYFRFHVHTFSPFWFELFPTFLRADLRPMLSYPKLRCLLLLSFSRSSPFSFLL